jgi:hypothetical protein
MTAKPKCGAGFRDVVASPFLKSALTYRQGRTAVNIRRGLFRLWVIFASLMAIGSVISFAGSIKRPDIPRQGYIILPTDDKFFKVREGVRPDLDRDLRKVEFPNRIDGYIPVADTEEAYRRILPRFRAEVVDNREAEIPALRLEAFFEMVSWATIPSAVLLALGSALLWAFSGFKRNPA